MTEDRQAPQLNGETPSNALDTGQLVETAITDLSERLEIPPSSVRLEKADRVTWKDGSLGCPRKGMMYTQALVPGIRIVLSAEGKQYEYHSGGDGAPFYCATPEAPSSVNSPE